MNIISDDFKPASVDTSQESQVEVGKGHHVTLTVPHVEVGRTSAPLGQYESSHNMGLVARKVFVVSNKPRQKPVSSATQTS